MKMEVKNSLLNFDAIIYQNEEWFKFSLDSLLLVNFVTINLRCKKIMDFACGNAPIPMLLSYRTKGFIYGIELQKCIYELGVKSIKENGMDNNIKLLNFDVRDVKNYFNSDSFDMVLCNPPYFKVNGNGDYLCENEIKRIARHEVTLNLDDILINARYLLKNGGIFAMVHRSDRFVEIITKMIEYNIEPKRVQFVYAKKEKNSELVLIEGIMNGKPGMKVLPGLIISNTDGSYTETVKKMFSK